MPLKTWLLFREIRKKSKEITRERQFHNLESAQSFAVVFDATHEREYQRVSSFIRHLQNHKKTVKAIGLIQAKEKPHFIMERLSYDFITKKDLAFDMRPKNNFVRDFIREDYDVLIDFNLKLHPVLTYLTALSVAKFKIGLWSEEMKDFLDFMITNVSHDDMAAYAKELIYFLETLPGPKGE